jgi:glyoxylate utilization-related uncharacterized protein
MTPINMAGFIASLIAIIAGCAAGVRWLVKHYLAELKPNGGASLRDSVNRLETQMQIVLDLLAKK